MLTLISDLQFQSKFKSNINTCQRFSSEVEYLMEVKYKSPGAGLKSVNQIMHCGSFVIPEKPGKLMQHLEDKEKFLPASSRAYSPDSINVLLARCTIENNAKACK